MLKYIGYKGHIVNYPEWINYNLKRPVKNLFRLI